MHYFLLDTNTVSYIARGRSTAARLRLRELEANDVACISTITEAEIRYGLAKKPQAHELRRGQELFLSRIKILPWGSEEALVYAHLRARLETSGKTLENMDMLIASHAIAIGATLVTNDKALLRLEGLHGTENWATDV
jgi:tRNA(fMet)-specific endonuclease VapC